MAKFRFNRPISLRWNGLLFEGPALTVFEVPDEYNDELQSAMLVEPTFEWVDQDEGNTIRARITALENAGAGAPLSNSNPLSLGTAAPGTGLSSRRTDHVHPTTGLSLSGHTHATSDVTSGNFAATVTGGTGVTVTGGTGNASTPSIAIGQAVGTTSDVTFNDVTLTNRIKHASQLTFSVAATDAASVISAGFYLPPGKTLKFEGTTPDSFETDLTVVDPTADRTITFPDDTGTVSLTSHTHTSLSNNLQINKADSKLQLLNTTSGSGAEDGMYLLMADTNVGYLWNAEANGALVLGTGGAERARITPAGKFGIGTNSPAHQLEIVGPASVTVGVSAGGAGFAELELVGQAGKNYITSDDTLSFDIGGTERATIATTGLDVTSGTLSQGGTAVSLSGHSHSTSNITSGNFAATVSGGTGVTVTGGTGNASTPSIAIGQAVGTTSNVQFNNVQTDGYANIPNMVKARYSLGGTANSGTTITTAGTYYALTSQEVSFTPAFVGQKFLVTYTGSTWINTTTIQYSFIRMDITDSSNNQISTLGFTRAENFGTSNKGMSVGITDIWTADSTSARKVKLYGTNQTTNGLVLVNAYTCINVVAIG